MQRLAVYRPRLEEALKTPKSRIPQHDLTEPHLSGEAPPAPHRDYTPGARKWQQARVVAGKALYQDARFLGETERLVSCAPSVLWRCLTAFRAVRHDTTHWCPSCWCPDICDAPS